MNARPELSRRRVAGWLAGTATAGAALVMAGPVAALTAPPNPQETRDGRDERDLATIAAKFCDLEKAFDNEPCPDAKFGTPENERNDEHSRLICQAQNALAESAAAHEAKTAAGLRAKAQMLAAFFGDDWPEEGCAIGTLLRSFIEDAASVRDGAV